MGIIGALIIGALCGMFAGMIVKGHGFGCLGNIVVGLVGAGLFGVLFGSLNVFGNELANHLLGGTLGAIGLLLVIGLFTKSR
ncbi:MAG: GlsB/YeaQ/YmgE family stress response membrane protein [Mariniblastus sp.]|nr:GlsB/YeaQ/YmgE family stress response membrane protein [Mariniblastus sp.]